MHRYFAVALITSLVFAGALHHQPLWLFVLAVPIWLLWWLEAEEQRIRAEAIQQVRERIIAGEGME